MSEQGARRSNREDDWWRQLYDDTGDDTGPDPAGDTVDDRFTSARDTLAATPLVPPQGGGTRDRTGGESGDGDPGGRRTGDGATGDGARGDDAYDPSAASPAQEPQEPQAPQPPPAPEGGRDWWEQPARQDDPQPAPDPYRTTELRRQDPSGPPAYEPSALFEPPAFEPPPFEPPAYEPPPFEPPAYEPSSAYESPFTYEFRSAHEPPSGYEPPQDPARRTPETGTPRTEGPETGTPETEGPETEGPEAGSPEAGRQETGSPEPEAAGPAAAAPWTGHLNPQGEEPQAPAVQSAPDTPDAQSAPDAQGAWDVWDGQGARDAQDAQDEPPPPTTPYFPAPWSSAGAVDVPEPNRELALPDPADTLWEPSAVEPWQPAPAPAPSPPASGPVGAGAGAGAADWFGPDPRKADASGTGEPGTGAVAYVGDRPPTYEAEPTALPEADPEGLGELTPDTVLDGARYGTCTLRAVSVRGDSPRYRGEPRRDALLTVRFGTAEQALVLVAMATGARATAGAHRAAAEACQEIGRAVGRHHSSLSEDIRAGLRGPLKAGLHRLTDRVLGRLRSRAAELGLPPEEYTATLRCLLLPADPDCRLRVFFGVGPGGFFRIRRGGWHDIEPHPPRRPEALPPGRPASAAASGPAGSPAAPASPAVPAPGPSVPGDDDVTLYLRVPRAPAPYAPEGSGGADTAGGDEDAGAAGPPPREPFRFRTASAAAGDTLLLCSEGFAEPLRGEPAFVSLLATRWSQGAPPGLAAFLSDTQIRVKGYADDRTVAAVWES